MAITAKVDNPERYAIQRGRHIFLGGVEGAEFSGSRPDFMQVKACTYLNVYDIQDDSEQATTGDEESVMENDQSKPEVKNDQNDTQVKNDQSKAGRKGKNNAESS